MPDARVHRTSHPLHLESLSPTPNARLWSMKTSRHLSDHLPRQPCRCQKKKKKKERERERARAREEEETPHSPASRNNSSEPFLREVSCQLVRPSSAIHGEEKPKPAEIYFFPYGGGRGGGGGGGVHDR